MFLHFLKLLIDKERYVNFLGDVTSYRSHSDPMAVLQTKYGLKGSNLSSTLTSTVRNIALLTHFLRQRFFPPPVFSSRFSLWNNWATAARFTVSRSSFAEKLREILNTCTRSVHALFDFTNFFNYRAYRNLRVKAHERACRRAKLPIKRKIHVLGPLALGAPCPLLRRFSTISDMRIKPKNIRNNVTVIFGDGVVDDTGDSAGTSLRRTRTLSYVNN